MASSIVAVVAGLLLARAVVLLVQERALRRRLVPVQARLAKGGDQAERFETPLDAARRTDITGSAIPATPDQGFHAVWTYQVDGKDYQVEAVLSSPVFRKEEVRFGRVQVFYDRANPSVSVPRPGASDQAWAWFVAAAVVGLVGLAIHLIGEV